MSMTFGEVEALLAQINGIRSDKRATFMARLKNFLRLGLLPGSGQGRGRPSTFGPLEIFILALAVEFTRCALSPEAVVDLLAGEARDGEGLAVAIGLLPVLDSLDDPEWPDVQCFYWFDPDPLRGLTENDFGDSLIFGGADAAANSRRASRINVAMLIQETVEVLGAERGHAFVGGLKAWAESSPQAVSVRSLMVDQKFRIEKMVKSEGPLQ